MARNEPEGVQHDAGRATLPAGHRGAIITLQTDRVRAEADLDRMGIAWTKLVVADDVGPGHWRWKAAICAAESVDVFFDDSADVLEHIPPSTVPFLALDLRRHAIGLLREFADEE